MGGRLTIRSDLPVLTRRSSQRQRVAAGQDVDSGVCTAWWTVGGEGVAEVVEQLHRLPGDAPTLAFSADRQHAAGEGVVFAADGDLDVTVDAHGRAVRDARLSDVGLD